MLRQQDERRPSTASSSATPSRTAPTSASTSSAPTPACADLVDHLSDDDLRNLPRGGHDYRKLYAAYKAATEQTGAPTVILAKTVKGWTLGPGVEGRNATHQIKKMTNEQLQALRDRLHLHEEIPEDALDAERPPVLPPGRGLRRVPAT